MTDSDPFDELASAHLDGATSPDEAARVAADPALQARVEELRVVRNLVAEVPTGDGARREAAIAAALAAFAEDAEPARRVESVTPLASRRGPSPRLVQALGAAAVIALLALLVPLLGNLDSGSDDHAAFESTGSAIGGAADDSAESATAPEASTTTASNRSQDLGAFEDAGSLLTAAAGAVSPSGEGITTDAMDAGQGCEDHLGSQGSPIVEAWTATLRGEAVLVVMFRTPTAQIVRIYDAITCAEITE